MAGGGGQPAAGPAPVEKIVPKVDCATQLSAAQIKAILRRENELRLAPETQRLFAAAAKTVGGSGWLDVVEDLQRHVAKEFGLSEQVGLDAMRRAEALLPGDPEVKEISLYRKFNRCVDGDLAVGDVAPDAHLLSVGTGPGVGRGCKATTVHSLLEASAQPLVLLVGSYT